jgi:hypothetical protein
VPGSIDTIATALTFKKTGFFEEFGKVMRGKMMGNGIFFKEGNEENKGQARISQMSTKDETADGR